ncbi:hypothetical protein E2C01_064698 [Portunus trituberculatus]|uniref:Uncharacterized protein n=1 Tax=Portunus trituberculatus TaxID=210409 RepID=A0A5B7HL22_PORTR|nr:hypothetical protein [Portunus trituberculatus]
MLNASPSTTHHHHYHHHHHSLSLAIHVTSASLHHHNRATHLQHTSRRRLINLKAPIPVPALSLPLPSSGHTKQDYHLPPVPPRAAQPQAHRSPGRVTSLRLAVARKMTQCKKISHTRGMDGGEDVEMAEC